MVNEYQSLRAQLEAESASLGELGVFIGNMVQPSGNYVRARAALIERMKRRADGEDIPTDIPEPVCVLNTPLRI